MVGGDSGKMKRRKKRSYCCQERDYLADAAGMVGMMVNEEENMVLVDAAAEEETQDLEVAGSSQLTQESTVNVGRLVDVG